MSLGSYLLDRRKKIAFSLIAFVAFFFVCEIGLRIFDAARGASPSARAYWFWGFQQDRFLGYRPRPNMDFSFAGGNKFDTNSLGYRDIETIELTPDPDNLIICMGESSTWGTGSSDRLHTWPRLLESELTKGSNTIWRTMNCGIPGYSLVENVQLLQLRLIKLKPKVLIYMGFRNDYVNYAGSLGETMDYNFYPRTLAPLSNTWTTSLLMESTVISACVTRWGLKFPFDVQEAVPPPSGSVTSRGRNLFLDEVAMLSVLCKRHGIRLIWADQPINKKYVEENGRKNLEELRSLLMGELEKQGIAVLPLANHYDHEKYPMLDDVHFSDAGNAHIAIILAKELLPILNESEKK